MEAAVEGPAGLILRTTNLMPSPGLLAVNVTPLWRIWHALTSQIRYFPDVHGYPQPCKHR